MSYDWAYSFLVLVIPLTIPVIYLILKLFICPSSKHINLKGKHVFITGGSKGIGFAMAVECIKRGASVTIVARNQGELASACDKLNDLAHRQNTARGVKDGEGQQARYYSLDLTKSYDEIVSIVTEAQRQLDTIDVLINNAGAIPAQGAIENIAPRDFERSLQLNVVSALWMTKAVVPHMKKRYEGRIVFVSSAAGQIGIWGYSAYSPAKFALRGVAEALQMELEPYGIRITVVYPPNTDTEGFKEELKTMTPEIKAISEQAGLWRPEDVAEAAIKNIVHGNFSCTFGLDGWMLGTTCAGAAPEPSAFRALQQITFTPLLRFIGLIYHRKFAATIRALQRVRAHSE